MRAFLCAAGLCLLGVGPASAGEHDGLRALVTANDTKGWEAVGRLDIGETGFCTGALIAPDLVLTAAHCLFDPDSFERIADSEITFLAGFRNGRATAYRGARSTAIHPDYVYDGPHSGDYVASDIALIALDQPIRNGSVHPFKVGDQPRKGASVQVVSYAHDRATRPSLEEACDILGRPAGSLVMSCDVDFGSSGAPVFSVEDGEPQIVSVISAKAEVHGRRVSLGTSLAQILPELRAALDEHSTTVATAAGPLVNRPVETTAPGRAGAKFVRP